MRVVVSCGDASRGRTGDLPGRHDLPARPGRADIDPLLDAIPVGRPGDARIVVAGDDAALAAVLVRLLRRERLDVALALLPAPGSVAATVWGTPDAPDAALALALDGPPAPAPLVRDDRGGVVVGCHRVRDVHGEVYVDEHHLWRGDATLVEITPDPVAGTRARIVGPRRLGGLRTGREVVAAGRAVQLGCRPTTVERDGEADDRSLTRRSWYRHVEDWWLVRPGATARAGSARPG